MLTVVFFLILLCDLPFFLSPVLPSLIDRLGDSKDSVREQDQALLLKIMEQAASPQVSSWKCTMIGYNDWVQYLLQDNHSQISSICIEHFYYA